MSTVVIKRKPGRLHESGSDKAFKIVSVAVLILVTIITLYPIYYVIIASVSNPTHIGNGEVILWPKGFTLAGYDAVLSEARIWTGYQNSIIYTALGTLLALAVVLPCSYSLSRESLPGKKWLFIYFLITMYFTGGVVPTYLLMNQLKLVNTVWVMIIPSCVNFGLSVFNLIVARNFFQNNIPEAMFESARLDGASVTRFFFSFVLPLSKSVIAVLTLFYALSQWNQYFNPMIYIQDTDKQTLQVIIRNITALLDAGVAESMDPGQISYLMQKRQLLKYAVVIVSIAPMLAPYPLIQRYFVTGIMLGAIKE